MCFSIFINYYKVNYYKVKIAVNFFIVEFFCEKLSKKWEKIVIDVLVISERRGFVIWYRKVSNLKSLVYDQNDNSLILSI